MNSTKLFQTYPYLDIDFVSANGCEMISSSGEKFLDFYAGISCTNLGHNNPKIVKALQDQSEKIWYHSNYFCHSKTKELAEKITDTVDFDAQVFFGNSGAEANEGALKLARRWAKINKSKNSTEIICFENSFHGRTMATLSCTGKKQMREDFAPLLSGVHFAKYNDIKSVKEKISDNTACIIIELIQGEGGVNIAEKKFIQELRKICDTENILLIFDEIQTGMGRTGTMWAFENYGVNPDIFTTAKALANGFPIGGFIAKKSISKSFVIGDHGTTFGGNPLACAVGSAVISEYSEIFLESVKLKGKILEAGLKNLQEKFPHIIINIRGKGMMWGLEMSAENVSAVYKKMLEEKKIITLTAGLGKVWRLLPPLTISEEEIQKFLESAQGVLGEL